MVMMAGVEMPLFAIRSQIASALDLIVQQSACATAHAVSPVSQRFTGMEGDIVSMQDIFTFDTVVRLTGRGALTGRFRSTGVYPNA